jgi:pentatricopeptide repeat protein
VGALIKEMMAASLTPNESVYASLIMSIAKSDLPNKRRRAKTVLHDMKKRGIEPNAFTQELIASIKEEA